MSRLVQINGFFLQITDILRATQPWSPFLGLEGKPAEVLRQFMPSQHLQEKLSTLLAVHMAATRSHPELLSAWSPGEQHWAGRGGRDGERCKALNSGSRLATARREGLCRNPAKRPEPAEPSPAEAPSVGQGLRSQPLLSFFTRPARGSPDTGPSREALLAGLQASYRARGILRTSG